MSRSTLTGTRIRERRLVLGIKQAELARAAGISPSYLNLIEHNRRRIGGKLLMAIAQVLGVDIAALTQGAEAEQLDQLGEAAANLPEAGAEVERIDEFIGRFPGWATLIAAQGRYIAQLENRVASLVDRLTHDPFLSAALHDLLTKAAAIQSTTSILSETEDLDAVWRQRFHRNLLADGRKLADGASQLVSYLDSEGEAELGRIGPQEELEAFLGANGFHFPGLEHAVPASVDALTAESADLQSAPARKMARRHLETYRNDALRMPVGPFRAAAVEEGCDPARLAERFGVDIPAVLRRLAAMPAGAGGEAVGLMSCDASGALTLRKPTDMLAAPRFGGACSFWPLFRALAMPGEPIRAVIENTSHPGQPFLAFAFGETRYPNGFGGPPLHMATMVVIPRSLADPADVGTPPISVGATCRVCTLAACPGRREPSILADGFDSALRIAQ